MDRKDLIIEVIGQNEKAQILIEEVDNKCLYPLHLEFRISDNLGIKKDKEIAVLDFNKLRFPLMLRKWQEGDFFTPSGMKGKKKLSDFFIDNKISIPEKEQIWLLCSANEIVWIVGHRISEKFKITETSKKAYIVQLLKK